MLHNQGAVEIRNQIAHGTKISLSEIKEHGSK